MTVKKEKDLSKYVSLSEKWSKCIDCQYNPNKNNKKVKRGDYELFSCNANVDEFPCDKIPELYPYKLSEPKIKDTIGDAIVKESTEEKVFSLYEVSLFDNINDVVVRYFVVSDNRESIRKILSKRLDKRAYKHVKIFKIEKIFDKYHNHKIFVAPNEVNKVVYPEINIELDHFGKPIKIKELVYELKRYPLLEDDLVDKEKANISFDEGLSTYEEKNK